MNQQMTRRFGIRSRGIGLLVLLGMPLGMASFSLAMTPTAAANAGFDRYAAALELRLGKEHGNASAFLVLPPKGTDGDARLRRGELVVERLTPRADPNLPGAMLHDWRGTAFIPGANAADFERLLQDLNSYPRRFAPEILAARAAGAPGDRVEASMRVQQKHVITVTLDTTYEVQFGRLDPRHGFSISRSTRIQEIDKAGTREERALSPSDEHGFLWRLNTYWSWAERDGGLYVQIESISLTRAIPTGLGWAIGPFVESVPRDSLEFTLRAARAALAAK